MTFTSTAAYKTLCRLLVFCFAFQSLHPAALGVPKTFDLKIRISDAGSLTFDFWTLTFDLQFGPRPVYGQALDPNLASTPETDLTDTFIINKAAELNHDPAQIFAFMREEIGYEAYQGSLRGARGTLWSKAGNALDQASLMIALLRASSIKARYVKGTLATAEAQEVILSMFPLVLRIVGCPPADALKADPANDPKLLADAKEHYWVEYGDSFTPADPTFPDASLGQTFTSKQDDFTEVPDTLRHKVTVRLKAEHHNLFSALTTALSGSPFETVLNHEFITAALVGRPLSIGHFVNSENYFDVTITHTYSPYILVGENDGNIEDDEIIRGTDFQEVFGAFSAFSTALTGLFLEIDVKSPDGKVETHERALVDRVGYVVRQNGGTAAINIGSEEVERPAITGADIVTLSVQPSIQDPSAIEFLLSILEPQVGEAENLSSLLDQLNESTPESEAARIAEQAISFGRTANVAVTSLANSLFFLLSDSFSAPLAHLLSTRAYSGMPRVVLSKVFNVEDHGSSTSVLSFDIVSNRATIVAKPGQQQEVKRSHEFARGFVDNTIERRVVDLLASQEVNPSTVVDVFEKTRDQGGQFKLITKSTFHLIDTLSIRQEAKIRIAAAVDRGVEVLIPDEEVTINGVPTIGWFEIDPITGYVVDRLSDGTGGLIEYAILAIQGLRNSVIVAGFIRPLVRYFLGVVARYLEALRRILQAVRSNQSATSKLRDILKIIKNDEFAATFDDLFKTAGKLNSDLGKLFIGAGLIALSLIARQVDPPLLPFLLEFPEFPPSSFGSTPGVVTQIIWDELFTFPLNNPEFPFDAQQLPSVYRVQIQNTGPTTDTFHITLPPPPAGYEIQSSVSEITVPPGQTAEVGICLRPINSIGAPGTSVPFSVTVTGTGTSATDSETFVTPDVHGVTLTPDPAFTSASPGSSVPVELTITAAGNVAENATLSADLPTGVTLNGLPANVSLAQGETQTFPLTLNVSNSAALNSTLTTTITATIAGAVALNDTQSTTIQLSIRSAAVVAVEQAAAKAADADHTQLASVLSQLSDTLAQWHANPTDTALCARAQLQLDNLRAVLEATPSLAQFVPQVDALRAEAASCNLAGITPLLEPLFADICAVFLLSQSLALSLSPASVTLEPGQGQTFDMRLENQGDQTLNISLAVGALPGGVTASLDETQVSIAPSEVRTVPLTLSQTLTSTQIFALAVTATAGTASQVAYAHVAVRPAVADVVSVSANPNAVDAGESIALSARIQNRANAVRSILARLEVLNAVDAVIATLPNIPIDLEPGAGPLDVDLGQVSTTGLANGLFALRVSLLATDQTALPGRNGRAPFFVGLPVSATVRAEPSLLAPGNPTAKTIIEVKREQDFTGTTPGDPPQTQDGPATVDGAPFTLVATHTGPELARMTADYQGRMYMGNLSTAGLRIKRFDPASFTGAPVSLEDFGPLVGDGDGIAFDDSALVTAERTGGIRKTPVDGSASTLFLPEVPLAGSGLPLAYNAVNKQVFVGGNKPDGTPHIEEYSLDENLARLPGVSLNVSSTYGSAFVPELAIDGNPSTKWLSQSGDAVNLGMSPFYEVELPRDATVTELQIVGDSSYRISAGVFQVFAADGTLLNSRTVSLTSPSYSAVVSLSSIPGVRRVRFMVTQDVLGSVGIKELTVIGLLDGGFSHVFDVGEENVARVSGGSFNVSSTYGPAFAPGRAVDGNLSTKWLSQSGDAVNRGGTPFYEIVLPRDASIKELQIVGDSSYRIFSGFFQLFAADGTLLFDSGTVSLSLATFTTSVVVPSVSGVRRVRFTVTQDTISSVGISELSVIGRFADTPPPSAGQTIRAMAFDPVAERLYYAIGRDVRELTLSPFNRKDRLIGTVSGEIKDLVVDSVSSGRLFVGIQDSAGGSRVDSLNPINGQSNPLATGFTRIHGMSFYPTTNELYVLDGTSGTGGTQSLLYRVQPQSSIKADFVFILDNSGSMSDDIAAVRQGLNSFIANVAGAGIDARFAIVTFGGTPCLVLNFARNITVVHAAFDNLTCGGGDEAGLEAIRMVLGETATITGGIGSLQFRPDARKNLILLTDEDSDAPTSDANVLPGQTRSANPPNTILNTVWQQEVDLTAQAVIRKQAFVNLLINPSDLPSQSQYGDPASSVSDADLLNFDPEATLAALETNGFDQSLQAQVLRAGLIGRSFNITNVNTPNFVNNFFAAKVEEVVVNQPAMKIELRHLLPTSGYAVDPASILPAAEEATSSLVRWDASVPLSGPPTASFELSGVVPNLAAGESRALSLGAELVVTLSPLGSDPIVTTINLLSVTIAAAHIIDLDPTSRTVERGAQAAYGVLLTNPFSTNQTFNLSTIGLEGLEVSLDTSVNVPAGQTASVPLSVTVPAGTAEGTRVFSVQAQLAAGGMDTVDGELVIAGGAGGAGDPPGTVSLDDLAVDVTLTPTTATGGQGTPATYVVRVTNVGDEEDAYTLSGAFPPGFTGAFGESQVTLLPGLGNYRDVLLTVTPPPGTTVGDHPFTVQAVSQQEAAVQDAAAGVVAVLGLGVDVQLNPPTGGPGSVFQMTVKNTGLDTDTFALALGGPAAVDAVLETPAVTLASGAMQTVAITLGATSFALPGSLELIGAATSQTNAVVQDHDTATVLIGASKGLSAAFNPTLVVVPIPGTASFLLQVNNVGNEEDAYKAEIMGTTGPVTAVLNGLDRQPTQRIDTFRLPGLSSGGILMNAQLTAEGVGTVTVKVSSLTDTALTATAVATVRTPEVPLDPFLCYRTRSTTGDICAADAPMNVGGACESEVDCGGVEEDDDGDEEATDYCIPNRFPRGLRLSLVDRFSPTEERLFDLRRPLNLCNPAAVEGAALNDPDTHLRSFRINLTKGICAATAPRHAGEGCRAEEDCGGTTQVTNLCEAQAKPPKQSRLKIVNALHDAQHPLTVDTIKIDRLLVPSAKSLTQPVGQPGLNNVDRYACSRVRVTPKTAKFPKGLRLSAVDQFGQPKTYDVKRPTRLCTPVDLNGQGMKDPTQDLLCYRVRQVKGSVCTENAPSNVGGVCQNEATCGGVQGVTSFCSVQAKYQPVTEIRVNNEFLPELVEAVRVDELCLPSEVQ